MENAECGERRVWRMIREEEGLEGERRGVCVCVCGELHSVEAFGKGRVQSGGAGSIGALFCFGLHAPPHPVSTADYGTTASDG